MFTLVICVPRQSVQNWFSTDVRSRASGNPISVSRGSVGWPRGRHTHSFGIQRMLVSLPPEFTRKKLGLKGLNCYKDSHASEGGNIRTKPLYASNIPQPTDNAQQNRFVTGKKFPTAYSSPPSHVI